MSDKEWYLEHDRKPSLYAWVFQQMAMGAVYAGLFLVAIMGVILILYALGQLLPEDSKFAPPPMPQIEGSLAAPDDTIRRI
jgi:hypothetical protein